MWKRWIGSLEGITKGQFKEENLASEEDVSRKEELTSIHQRIHWPATANPSEELDVIAIEIFLETIVEVAMAIASGINTGGDGER